MRHLSYLLHTVGRGAMRQAGQTRLLDQSVLAAFLSALVAVFLRRAVVAFHQAGFGVVERVIAEKYYVGVCFRFGLFVAFVTFITRPGHR